jgi:hypothetical protein
MRAAPVYAVLAAVTLAGCSASQSLSASALSPAAAAASRSAAVRASSSAGAAAATAPGQAATPAGPATATASAGATGSPGTTGSTGTTDGNITIAPADGMAAGPMTITPVYCGALSAAQQARFGTTATGGLIYRFANHSGEAAAAKLYVAFSEGSTLAGANYAGTLPVIASGASAEAEVDAVGISGQNVEFSRCKVESYALEASAGVDPVSYAGLRSEHARNP